jgi:23S rRNA (guanosine2251-2'-O)-methyltransferase
VEEALRAASGRVSRVALVEGALSPPLARILGLAERAGVRLERRPRSELDRLAPGGRHQGVVAWSEEPRCVDLEVLLSVQPPPSLLVALDQVTDPGNLGAALRSAAAFGADGVVLPERGSAGLGETVRRRSAGAVEHLRVARVVNLARALKQMKEAGIWVVGLEPAAPPLWEVFDLTQRVALVLGGEGRGLRRLTRELCDVRAGIPMGETIGSLNVAVACGVALYEVTRQRRVKPVAGGS